MDDEEAPVLEGQLLASKLPEKTPPWTVQEIEEAAQQLSQYDKEQRGWNIRESAECGMHSEEDEKKLRAKIDELLVKKSPR